MLRNGHELTKKEELLLRNEVIMATVQLLNTFGEFIQSPPNSPQEDQLEATLDELLTDWSQAGTNGLAGHIVLALAAILVECANPDAVQEWLNDAGQNLMREAEALRAED